MCPSFSPGLLCGNNLDRAWGIFNNQRHRDVYVASLVGYNCCVCVITGRCWGIRCKSGGLLVAVISTGVALGIGVSAALISHFLWKQRFLSVSLPDPLTPIQYWQYGMTVMIFPVVFHWWLSGLWMATVSPACNGERLRVYLLYLSTILALWWRSIFSWCYAATTYLECG